MSSTQVIAQGSKRPLISIVMPYWNSLPFIEETLDSIAAQSFLDMGEGEFIMYDDGSPRDHFDALRRIVARFQDRFQGRFANFSGVYTVPNNMGKNMVLEQTKPHINERSEYVVVFDSDDVYYPDFLKVLFTHLEQQRAINPDLAMAYCDSLLIDRRGYLCGTGNAPPFDRGEYFDMDNDKNTNYIPGNALVVRDRFVKGVPADLEARNRDKQRRHIAELGETGIAVHIGYLNGEVTDPRKTPRLFFYRQHEDQMSGHMDQLAEDPRYGPDGFFGGWPKEIRKPHWKEWLSLPEPEKQRLLNLMPMADTKAWSQYKPRKPAPSA